MSWRTADMDPQTIKAVLAQAYPVGWEPSEMTTTADSNVFASGFWAVWVRCCFHAERRGWIELWQRGSDGRVYARLTELGERQLERMNRV